LRLPVSQDMSSCYLYLIKHRGKQTCFPERILGQFVQQHRKVASSTLGGVAGYQRALLYYFTLFIRQFQDNISNGPKTASLQTFMYTSQRVTFEFHSMVHKICREQTIYTLQAVCTCAVEWLL